MKVSSALTRTTWSLQKVLSVPPVLVVDICSGSDGRSVRRLRYSGTAQLEVRGDDIVQLIDELERRRIRQIIESVSAGEPILCLRRPLVDGPVTISSRNLRELLEEIGMAEWMDRLETECCVDLGPLD
jgi:hypothetical protein